MTKHERTRTLLLEIVCAALLLSLAGLGAYTYYILHTVAPIEAHRQCIDFIDETVRPKADAECNAALSSTTAKLAACIAAASSTPSR